MFKLFSTSYRSSFARFSHEEEEIEIPFEVQVPEGFVPFEWVSDVVIRVTALQLEVEPETITLNQKFQKDLNADSLDIVEINMKIEKMLNIEVPDYCLGLIISVDDATRIIHHIVNGEPLPWDKKKTKKPE